MIGNFSTEVQEILINAKEEMDNMNHQFIGTEHLLLSILKQENIVKKKLNEMLLDYDKFKDEVTKIVEKGKKKTNNYIYTPLMKKIIQNSIMNCKDNNEKVITLEYLFYSFLEENEGIAIRIFYNLNIDVDKLFNDFEHLITKKKSGKINKKLIIEELGTNITNKAIENELDPVIGREKECLRVLEVLSRRTKNNPILIGKAGVGKTAIVEEVSRMIAVGNVSDNLKHKKVISLDMATLVAGTKYRGEFEDRMKKILKEVEDNKNIILFIDEIHTLVGAGGAEGAIDASNILKPALARGRIRCIGATTINEYNKFIKKDSALDRRFQKIQIKEPTIEETKNILLKLKEIYESFHNVKIEDNIINDIVELSEKYIYNRNRPDKEIDVLDEVCAKVNIKNTFNNKEIPTLKDNISSLKKEVRSYILDNNIKKAFDIRKKEIKLISKLNHLELLNKYNDNNKVTKRDVTEVIKNITNIPIYELNNDMISSLKIMEKKLKKKVIGQENAISSLINITRRLKMGYKENKCSSYLFIGPTGVGKTLLSKIYASILVGEQNTIKLDMSEYSDITSVNKIIGSSPGYVGYDDNKSVLDEISMKPNSVIILDEIDKAHAKVIELFYQILDEGKITNNKGESIIFNNNIIIMTSNVGFEHNNVGFNISEESINFSLREHFSNAFINRIDNTIIFNTLSKKDVIRLIKLKLESLKDKYSNYKIDFSDNLIEEICKKINYIEYGARKIEKVITSELESIILDNILLNNYEMTIDTLTKVNL